MAARGEGGEDVYATLLLTDTYLPGALVLAHSLRDAGTRKKLAALVTLDSVSAEAITKLKSVYHYVIPVPRIRNAQPANLQLMNRTDLHSAFTKITLWSQTQFRKIVYVDADVVAYRAPDELFDIARPFSAAPDIGWPDLFNTGVMVLTPNMGDYYAMMAMAERGISLDGADQGLINTYFRDNYNRISFTYNVTPSAHYQYVPAYRHFQSSINMVHFIGPDKPWFKGRHASMGNSPFDEMTGRWWAVYDRHYRVASPKSPAPTSTQPPTTAAPTQPTSEPTPYLTKGEYQPKSSHIEPPSKHYSEDHHTHEHHDAYTATPHKAQQHPTGHHSPQQTGPSSFVSSDVISSPSNNEATQTEAGQEQVHAQGLPASRPELEQVHAQGLPVSHPEPEQVTAPFQPSMSTWDAQRHPPPAESKPEAIDFPATIYEMSRSTAPFIAPQKYPEPPKGMWYEVPKNPPAAPSEPPKPIFPWESHRPKPSRVFESEIIHGPAAWHPDADSGGVPEGQPSAEPPATGGSGAEQRSDPVAPTTPTIQISRADPWTTYSRTNAWDEVPEIERYVDSIRGHQRSRSLKSPGMIALRGLREGVDDTARGWRGSRVTDFPSETERPSLPVTPAPIRRQNFWDGGPSTSQGDSGPLLPAAVGVPGQGDWDPMAQLQKLAKQHSDELLQKLSSGGRDSNLPPRRLPVGSEELISPTYVARSAQLVSPRPVKGSASSGSIRNLITDLERTPRTTLSPPREAIFSAPASTSEESTPQE